MAGLLNRRPYPDQNLSDAIVVAPVNGTLVFARDDASIGTKVADTGDPSKDFRPAQAGDVLSWNFDHWEGRVAGTNGPYEVYGDNPPLAVYLPDGQPKNTRGFLYVPQVPNL